MMRERHAKFESIQLESPLMALWWLLLGGACTLVGGGLTVGFLEMFRAAPSVGAAIPLMIGLVFLAAGPAVLWQTFIRTPIEVRFGPAGRVCLVMRLTAVEMDASDIHEAERWPSLDDESPGSWRIKRFSGRDIRLRLNGGAERAVRRLVELNPALLVVRH